MRILQVSDAYLPFPGGVGEHIYNLKKYLERLGHEVYVLTAGFPGLVEEVDTNVIRRGKVVLTPALKIFNYTQLTLTFDPELPGFLKEFYRVNRFDVVHLHGPLAPNLPGLALRYSRYPSVATFHTAFVGFNWNKIARIFFEKDARKLRKFIFVSNTAKEAVIPPYRGDWIIIPNGVDLELFYPQESGKFVRGKVNIGFLSRHEPRKGLDVLLEAFAEDKELKENAHLIIGSSGPLTESYKKFCEENNIPATFLGKIPKPELPDFYRRLDVFIAPALGGESFGLILLEAMACGTPVIASNIEGYRNVIIDMENGLLFERGNSLDLASKIKRLISDENLKLKIIQRGLEFVKPYHWFEIAKRVEQVYKEIV
uniref:Glycosyltransferase family 1 protein n=1 Tax=candidate division WOR-3 bacterium TaxID=2052148 RepID=A0A7V4E446_UNCW3